MSTVWKADQKAQNIHALYGVQVAVQRDSAENDLPQTLWHMSWSVWSWRNQEEVRTHNALSHTSCHCQYTRYERHRVYATLTIGAESANLKPHRTYVFYHDQNLGSFGRERAPLCLLRAHPKIHGYRVRNFQCFSWMFGCEERCARWTRFPDHEN